MSSKIAWKILASANIRKLQGELSQELISTLKCTSERTEFTDCKEKCKSRKTEGKAHKVGIFSYSNSSAGREQNTWLN